MWPEFLVPASTDLDELYAFPFELRSEFDEKVSNRTHRRVSGDNLFGAGFLCLCDQGFDIQGIENIRRTVKRSADPFCGVT